jgi:hypothetical protein
MGARRVLTANRIVGLVVGLQPAVMVVGFGIWIRTDFKATGRQAEVDAEADLLYLQR